MKLLTGVLCPHAGRTGSGQRIVLRRLDVTARLQGQGGAAAAADRARRFWRGALEVHAAQSSPDLPVTEIAAADGAGAAGDTAAEAQQSLAVPRWRLKCSREQQLQRLCLRFTTLCTDYLTQVPMHAPLGAVSKFSVIEFGINRHLLLCLTVPCASRRHRHSDVAMSCIDRSATCSSSRARVGMSPGTALDTSMLPKPCPQSLLMQAGLPCRMRCSRAWSAPATITRHGRGTCCACCLRRCPVMSRRRMASRVCAAGPLSCCVSCLHSCVRTFLCGVWRV